MTPEKAARANSMHQKVQSAHIRSIVELHHAPTLEQMLESYQQAFESYMERPGRSVNPELPDRQVPEHVLRLVSAEAVVIREILAERYDADKQIMLGNIAGDSGSLGKMPAIMDFLPLKPKT